MGDFSGRYVFEPELQHPVPRPMPYNIDAGDYSLKLQRHMKGWFSAAVCCFILTMMPFTRPLSDNLLFLQYLEYIGLACLIVAIGHYCIKRFRWGFFNYLRRGVPISAEVLSINKNVKRLDHGLPAEYCFAATVAFQDPNFKKLGTMVFYSNGFPAHKKDLYETNLKPGDRITALYLPNRSVMNLKIYGFLGLNPEVQYLKQKGFQNHKEINLWSEAIKVLGLAMFFGLLFGGLYVSEHYWPVNGATSSEVFWLSGGVALLFSIAALIAMVKSETFLTIDESDKAALWFRKRMRLIAGFLKGIISLATGLFTFFIILSILFTINALKDKSKPLYQIVKIDQMTQTTYDFLYRNYKIDYQYPTCKTKETIQVSRGEIQAFRYDFGLIEIHRGFFGWSWVKRIVPVNDVKYIKNNGILRKNKEDEFIF